METINQIEEFVTNEVYNLQDTQFDVNFDVRCLGNFGIGEGEKVYLTKATSKETTTSLKRKFKNNRLPDAFVCWDFMLNTNYVIRKK